MKIAWIDTETTGLDPKKHGLIQVAVIIDIDGKVVARADYRLNPVGKEIDMQAMLTNGIAQEQLAAYPPMVVVKGEIEKFFGQFVDKYDRLDKFVAAGYNVDFDLGFLEQLWLDCGDKFFYSWFERVPLDIYRDHRMLEWLGAANAPANRKLETVARMYGVEPLNAHDAAADVEMTYNIAQLIKERFSKGREL